MFETTLPIELDINNKTQFPLIFFNNKLRDFRKDIYEYMLNRENENEYYDLDLWCRKNIKHNTDIMHDYVNIIKNELINLGWNCKTSFGNTGLFIYSTDKPPSSCYEDGF
jgi:hypothetical protein